ncbi:PEP-CTERM sorting domain-containing protein [Massilia consociata]|uniref:PEP-CTERM sorting domain-containing protein n=1 Tax=Massilia consociata TaxID=760117 RepID=A0ABV6FE58_9BURK
MIKRLLALAAGSLLSLNAFAGYIQYDLSGPVSGHIVQHESDQSIAYFWIDQLVTGTPYPFIQSLTPVQQGEGATVIRATTTYFRNDGPTNFSISSDFGADQTTWLDIAFSRGAQGSFSYTANHANSIYLCGDNGCGFESFSGTLSGSASRGVVDPQLASYLDFVGGYYDGIAPAVPTYVNPGPAPAPVPEPGSLALLALGALGLAGMRRKTAN